MSEGKSASVNVGEVKDNTQKKSFREYLTRANVIAFSIFFIAVFSWFQPEMMKRVLAVIWSIIY